MHFDMKTEQLSETAYVVSLSGEVDLYTAPEFKQQLLEEIDVERRTRCLLDHLTTQTPPTPQPETDRPFPPGFSAN